MKERKASEGGCEAEEGVCDWKMCDEEEKDRQPVCFMMHWESYLLPQLLIVTHFACLLSAG